MSERKAYRVRQHELSRPANGYETMFDTELSGHPYIAIPWPEDCPWDPEDFPLPGETVVAGDGKAMTIEGPPKMCMGGWRVPLSTGATLLWESVRFSPSIWNSRKDAEPEVVGTLEVVHGGFDTLDFDVPVLKPGRYKIIRDD